MYGDMNQIGDRLPNLAKFMAPDQISYKYLCKLLLVQWEKFLKNAHLIFDEYSVIIHIQRVAFNCVNPVGDPHVYFMSRRGSKACSPWRKTS